jgi:glucose-1-phosphatase
MAIRALLWDVGGVLLRTEDPSPRRRWEERLGLPAGRLADVVFGCPAAERATVGELVDEDVWRQAVDLLGVPRSELAKFKVDFFAGDRWDETLLEFIRSVRFRCRLGILSNAWLGARATFAEHLPPDVFDVILFSAEEQMRKPEERFFRLALGQLGAAPEETIFIDDIVENIEGARRIGFQTLHFQNSEITMAEIRRMLSQEHY